MGKGHSNLPESTFHVLTKFRSKDVNLLHYEFSTNLGFCQSSLSNVKAVLTTGPEISLQRCGWSGRHCYQIIW